MQMLWHTLCYLQQESKEKSQPTHFSNSLLTSTECLKRAGSITLYHIHDTKAS